MLDRLIRNVPGMVYRCRNEPGWPMSFVSQGARDITGYDPERIESGAVSWGTDVIHPADRDRVREAVAEGVAGAGRFTLQYRIRTADGTLRWVRERGCVVGPDEGVLEGVITDITEQKRTEAELAAETAFVDSLLDAQQDIVYALGPEGTLRRWNDRLAAVTGYAESTLDGIDPLELIAEPDREAAATDLAAVRAGERRTTEFRLRTAGGHTVPYQFTGVPVTDEDGEVVGVTGIGREVSARKARERRLRAERDDLEDELDEVFARIDDAFYAVDEDFRFTYVNDRAETLLEADRGDLLGREVWKQFPEAAETEAWDAFHEALASQDPQSFELFYDPLGRRFSARVHPSESGLSVYFRDVTERREREVALEQRERVLREVHDVTADPDRDFDETVDTLFDIGCDVLDTDFATLSQVSGDRYQFEYVRAPNGEIQAGDTLPLSATNCERVVETRETVALPNLQEETPEFVVRPGSQDLGIAAYLGAPVIVDGSVEGTFCFYDAEAREAFSDWEVALVDLLAQWIGAELTSQMTHDRLAALNALSGVVREINRALVEQSSREEIERMVCERLAAADAYSFAWIGEADPQAGVLRPNAEAGVEGYLDGTTVSLHADDPHGRGPAARAVRTRETQVTTDALTDPDFEPWRDLAEAYGFRSAAAIPIVHGETLYGLLAVYSDRVGGFDAEERTVVSQLGGTIGHAIAAVERKRALTSEQVVELDLRVHSLVEVVDLGLPPDEQVVLENLVPLGDGEYVAIGRTSPAGFAAIQQLESRLDEWVAATRLDREGEDVHYELHVEDPPILTAVVDRGGVFERATIDNDEVVVTVQLPPTADVRRLVETIDERAPGVELVTRTQRAREQSGARAQQTLATDLTERQRAALEVSFQAGYFEWPRESDGAAVAGALGVSEPTFHQHLRTAQRKVFESLLS